ncbi:MAG: sulfotransferase family 2 domain-containing protein, partial [Pseudomonadota bacterium]
MYISSGRRFVFVHIPKTGGTSMTRALESRAMADDLPIGDTPKARQRRRRLKGIDSAGRLWKHSTLADIDGLVAKSFIDDALVVSMVRNPWDRVFSLYTWSRMQRFDHPLVRLSRDTDFSDFLNAPLCAAALKARPYAHYVTDCSGQERDCLWIRLEHWQEDAEPLW